MLSVFAGSADPIAKEGRLARPARLERATFSFGG